MLYITLVIMKILFTKVYTTENVNRVIRSATWGWSKQNYPHVIRLSRPMSRVTWCLIVVVFNIHDTMIVCWFGHDSVCVPACLFVNLRVSLVSCLSFQFLPASHVLRWSFRRLPASPVLWMSFRRLPVSHVLCLSFQRLPASHVLCLSFRRLPSSLVLCLSFRHLPASLFKESPRRDLAFLAGFNMIVSFETRRF